MVLISLDLAVAEEDKCDGKDYEEVVKKARNVRVVLAYNDVYIHQRELEHEHRECGEISGPAEQHRKADKADIAHHGEDAGE